MTGPVVCLANPAAGAAPAAARAEVSRHRPSYFFSSGTKFSAAELMQ
jgi:hypothetical protein